MRIGTILCPVDFSDVSGPELAVAVDIGRAFRGRLVLFHDLPGAAPGMARAWDWEASHHGQRLSRPEADRRMQALLRTVPKDVPVEGVVSEGPLLPTVLAIAEQVPCDLIVLGSHGRSTEDHASLMERLLERAPCAVLSLHAGPAPALSTEPGASLRAVVPTDRTAASQRAVEYAFDLARTLPLELELLHVLPERRAADAAALHAELAAMAPTDLAGRVSAYVRTGQPTAEIVDHLTEREPDLAILGGHAPDLLRRFFTHDTARDVAHAARCPVWVVPARGAG